jgi:hypothetical protein
MLDGLRGNQQSVPPQVVPTTSPASSRRVAAKSARELCGMSLPVGEDVHLKIFSSRLGRHSSAEDFGMAGAMHLVDHRVMDDFAFAGKFLFHNRTSTPQFSS